MFKELDVNRYRTPSLEVSNFRASQFGGGWPFPNYVSIKLLQHLNTDSAALALPELSTPFSCFFVLFRIGSIERIKEDIRVNEYDRGHELPPAFDKDRPNAEGSRASAAHGIFVLILLVHLLLRIPARKREMLVSLQPLRSRPSDIFFQSNGDISKT
jgi:hypothetical protein